MTAFIEKLEKSGLKGRGGSGFPTFDKWKTVLETKAEQKYLICNGAEGEPGVKKDHYILENFPEIVIEGIKIGLETFENSKAIIYLKSSYFREFGGKLKELIGDLPIGLHEKKGGYLAGEETTIVSVLEGKIIEPKIKPPYPCKVGINGCPTLVNNVETWYHIAKIDKREYKNTRFFTIGGKAKNPGVFERDENYKIEKLLKETDNYPNFNFFVQSGGEMSGEILLPEELNQTAKGQGAIIIYDRDETDSWELMQKWINFFYKENCDKCTPCREGVYRIKEMFDKKIFDQEILKDVFYVLEKTSFCSLGKVVSTPIKSFYQKIGL